MDWFSLLLFGLFFVFPLVQEVMKARRKASEERADSPSLEEAPPSPAGRHEPAPAPLEHTPLGGDPRDVARDRSSKIEEVLREIQTRTTEGAVRREVPNSHERTPRDREPRPDLGPEKVARRPRSPAGATRLGPRSPAVAGQRGKQPLGRRQLGSVEGLRSSIIVAEVLAPPVSMRDSDERI